MKKIACPALLATLACLLPCALPMAAAQAKRTVRVYRALQQGVTIPLVQQASLGGNRPPARKVHRLAARIPGISFQGLSSRGWSVPDANGAAGATQYVQYVNTEFAVYDKATGALLYGPAAGNTLWSSLGGTCAAHNNGDPLVQYDKLANVWVFAQRVSPSNGPYYICLAVSQTSDATGAYDLFVFQLPDYYPDYPKIGIWPDAYYITYNELQPNTLSFYQSAVCAYDRTAILDGGQPTSQCVELGPGGKQSSLLPSDLDGLTPPPAGSPNYLLNLGKTQLNLWSFFVDFSDPANTKFAGPVGIPVANYREACGGGFCVPQSGTAQKLDGLGDRLMYRLAYRNFGDHESLVVTHSVNVGHASVGVRWYEIRSPGNNPYIYQQGTYSPDAKDRWMGSIAMDKVGDIALGYSVSSAAVHPSVAYTGRTPSDPLGSMEPEIPIITGKGSQAGIDRWGDYTSMTVDPTDDCTFWYTNEYYPANGNSNWTTEIASFRFNACQ